jgi:hypothetical protein
LYTNFRIQDRQQGVIVFQQTLIGFLDVRRIHRSAQQERPFSMKTLIAATVAFCAFVHAPLIAQDNPVVVELFTSQGCASCPPADALLQKLAKREDVIALALHVDYWDYIGWKDEYARAAHTKRQKRYAKFAGRHMIYTPQMIVNGMDDVVGVHADKIDDLIKRHGGIESAVSIKAERRGNRLFIHAKPASDALQGPLMIQIVQYTPHGIADITRGENAGRKLEYANIVDRWTLLEQWNGAEPYEAEAALDPDRPAVVLIQYPGPGSIVGAARAD